MLPAGLAPVLNVVVPEFEPLKGLPVLIKIAPVGPLPAVTELSPVTNVKVPVVGPLIFVPVIAPDFTVTAPVTEPLSADDSVAAPVVPNSCTSSKY